MNILKLVSLAGFEPAKSCSRNRRYRPLTDRELIVVGVTGFEPASSSFQARPSTGLTIHSELLGGAWTESNLLPVEEVGYSHPAAPACTYCTPHILVEVDGLEPSVPEGRDLQSPRLPITVYTSKIIYAYPMTC